VVTRSDTDRICGHRTTPLVIPEVLVLRVIFFFVVSVILGSYPSLIDDNSGSTVGLESCSEQEFDWLLEAYFSSVLLDEVSTSSVADSFVVETRQRLDFSCAEPLPFLAERVEDVANRVGRL